MTAQATTAEETSVRKSVTVKASVEKAFRVFTEGFDSWWPRSHHIGKSPMKKAILEGHAGGRCYTQQEDGTDCDWGKITVWEPPSRFVMAWLIDGKWQYQPDAKKASEVEVRFSRQADGTTRVDLEHRNFERMGPDGQNMRQMVGSPGGWGDLLRMFAEKAAEENTIA